MDPWLDNVPLAKSFSRFFELAENKLGTVEGMFLLGVGGGWRGVEVTEDTICVGGRVGW